MDQRADGIPFDPDEIVTPLPEFISRILRIPYYYLWPALGLAAGIAQVILYRKFEEPIPTEAIELFNAGKVAEAAAFLGVEVFKVKGMLTDYVLANFVYASIPFFMIFTVIVISRIFEKFTHQLSNVMTIGDEDDKENGYDWYARQIKFIFDERFMFIASVLFTAAFFSYVWKSGFVPRSELPQTTYYVFNFFMLFISGGFLYVIASMMMFVFRLSKKTDRIKINMFQHPMTGICSIGNLMFKVAVITTVLYIYGILPVLVYEARIIDVGITILFAFVMAAFFIVPQLKMHDLLVGVKRDAIVSFSGHLEAAMKNVTVDPSPENVQRVTELNHILASLNQMREWPFDLKSAYPIITGVLVPIVVATAKYLIEALNNNGTPPG